MRHVDRLGKVWPRRAEQRAELWDCCFIEFLIQFWFDLVPDFFILHCFREMSSTEALSKLTNSVSSLSRSYVNLLDDSTVGLVWQWQDFILCLFHDADFVLVHCFASCFQSLANSNLPLELAPGPQIHASSMSAAAKSALEVISHSHQEHIMAESIGVSRQVKM